MNPAQDLIVKCWFRLADDEDNWCPGTPDEDHYGPVDYATARQLALPVESVGAALVAAGKRPPVWWLG